MKQRYKYKKKKGHSKVWLENILSSGYTLGPKFLRACTFHKCNQIMLISDGSGTDSKMRRASVKIINKNKVVNALKAKAKKGKVIYNIPFGCFLHLWFQLRE